MLTSSILDTILSIVGSETVNSSDESATAADDDDKNNDIPFLLTNCLNSGKNEIFKKKESNGHSLTTNKQRVLFAGDELIRLEVTLSATVSHSITCMHLNSSLKPISLQAASQRSLKQRRM